MAKVRYSGAKSGPPTTEPDPNRPDSWDDPYRYMDLDFWVNDRPGDYFKQGFDPNDNRTIGTRLKDAWGAGMAAAENFKGVRFPYWAQNFQQPAQGALTLWAAGAAALGTKDWRTNWSGQAQPTQATYQGNQGGAYQYQPTPYVPAAGANLSNSDRLRIQQENLIANRKAERLASMPAWMKDMANTPIYNQAAAPGQGAGGGYYQAAPQQSLQQSQGRYYQAAGNPYAGRVPDNLKRGGQWEKRHNQAVMLRRAAMVARSKGGKG